MLRKPLFAIVSMLAICLSLFGCQSASDHALEILGDSAPSDDSAAPADPDSCEGEASANSEEMPNTDFGMDENTYLRETYKLENADNLDLIGYDELVWLALNKATSAVVVADAADETSADMVASAQEGAAADNATAYVYEPARDAADGDLDALAARLASDGIANLDGLSTNTVIIMSKLTVDGEGNPAPVNEVVAEPDYVSESISDAYGISCCGF